MNGIHGVEPKEAGNVIMDEAWARISLRLVPGMDPADVAAKVEPNYEPMLLPGYAKSSKKLVLQHGADTSTPTFQAAKPAFALGYQHEPVVIGCGASIPFVERD